MDHTLIENNINLARKAAHTVSRNPNYIDDLQAAAYLGLVEAAASYNPGKGTFTNWAWTHCHGRALRQLRHLTKAEQWRDLEDATHLTINPTDDIEQRIDNHNHTQQMLATLNLEERTLVETINGYRHNTPPTITQLAKQAGTTRQNMSNKYIRALNKLRKHAHHTAP